MWSLSRSRGKNCDRRKGWWVSPQHRIFCDLETLKRYFQRFLQGDCFEKNNFVRVVINWSLTLRGHLTNAFFKQWVGQSTYLADRALKNYFTPQMWEKTLLREIFYGTLVFSTKLYDLCWSPCWTAYPCSPNLFLLVSRQTFDSYAQMCYKSYHTIFSTFSLKFKCKICVQKEVIHNFKKKKNRILVTWPSTNLLILGAVLNNQITISLFKMWPNNHFHRNHVTWPLSANGLFN